jgi:hypothetical protein
MSTLRKLTLALLCACIAAPTLCAATTYRIPGTILNIDIRNQSADPTMQFTPSEVREMLDTLSLFPTAHLKVLKYIESEPSSTATVFTVDSAGGGVIVSFLNPTGLEQQAQRVDAGLGKLVHINYLSAADQAAWKALPGRTTNPMNDFGAIFYAQWYLNSLGNLANAISTLKTTGNSASLASFLFVASLFADSETNTITTYCEGPACKRFGSSEQTLTWSGNTIQLADWTFQVEQDPNQSDPNLGQYQIVSIQEAGQPPIDLSQNSCAIPAIFIARVPQAAQMPSVSATAENLVR